MDSQLRTVLEIAGVGTLLLFMALVGLVALMYLLTAWPLRRVTRRAKERQAADDRRDAIRALEKQEEQAERDRQLRAVALAVAVARAEAELPAALLNDQISDWRRIHRSRRLGQVTRRARLRR